MNDNRSQLSHKVYKNDPVSLKSYVNKTVSVKTRDGRDHVGVVYTIDPLSESIILINPNEEDMKMEIIMGQAIEGMEISSESETSLPELFLTPEKNLSEPLILRRKNAVKELLLGNCFPVTEVDGVLIVLGILTIEPPYDPQHCISNNEIVLLRIQEIVSNVVI